ncbi:MAG TPA: DUF4424 family protein [Rhizomicrobium sp.]|jgi:hypothetical protein|nr:DUF4424 family protein [Rhizomicrobium sp.]
MRSIRLAVLTGAALIAAMPSRADDSAASLGAGGLVFAKSHEIRMASEDLYISPEKVKVHFVFQNDSAKNIDTVVAFPLPDIDLKEYWESPIGNVTEDPVNFVGFKVMVDGRPVTIQGEQRAIFNGRDVTAIVKSAGLPVNVLGRGVEVDKLPKAKRQILMDAKIAEGDDQYLYPQWTIRTRFHWTQKFPAGKTVVVDHTYQPVTGGTFFTKYDMERKGKDDYWKERFCMDPPTLSRIHKMLKAASQRDAQGQDDLNGMLQINTTEYVLSTGNNWKGPIGKFHMTLDKLLPGNTLSLCWTDDLKKTSATTFEFTRANYAPDRDVRMVVLK